MAESDMSSLLSKLDIGDMAGFTRRFVDDFEAAMAMDVGIEVDSDWSGVICLGMGVRALEVDSSSHWLMPREVFLSWYGVTTDCLVGGVLTGWSLQLPTQETRRRPSTGFARL